MDLSELNIDLAEFFPQMLDTAARTIETAVRDNLRSTNKEYYTILGLTRAGFDCRVHPHDNAVLLLESFVGHDQLATIDWKAVFAALAQALHLDVDFSTRAAEFTRLLQGADEMQKVSCYLRVTPKNKKCRATCA